MNPDDLLQLTILLEQLTNRNDLYHLSLIKAANLALNIKDDLATAFEFCRVIVDNNYSTHGGWEICQTMATKMSSRHGCALFLNLIRRNKIFEKSTFSRNPIPGIVDPINRLFRGIVDDRKYIQMSIRFLEMLKIKKCFSTLLSIIVLRITSNKHSK